MIKIKYLNLNLKDGSSKTFFGGDPISLPKYHIDRIQLGSVTVYYWVVLHGYIWILE
jgi:hypothetical protein